MRIAVPGSQMEHGNTMTDAGRRLKAARERAGKSLAEVAEYAGLPQIEAYCDLEDHDDLENAISLRDIASVCRVVGISPRELLVGEQSPCTRQYSFDELARLVQQRLTERNISISRFEDEIGWGLSEFLAKPDVAWECTVDCLRAVCDAVGIDWTCALPSAR